MECVVIIVIQATNERQGCHQVLGVEPEVTVEGALSFSVVRRKTGKE